MTINLIRRLLLLKNRKKKSSLRIERWIGQIVRSKFPIMVLYRSKSHKRSNNRSSSNLRRKWNKLKEEDKEGKYKVSKFQMEAVQLLILWKSGGHLLKTVILKERSKYNLLIKMSRKMRILKTSKKMSRKMKKSH